MLVILEVRESDALYLAGIATTHAYRTGPHTVREYLTEGAHAPARHLDRSTHGTSAIVLELRAVCRP